MASAESDTYIPHVHFYFLHTTSFLALVPRDIPVRLTPHTYISTKTHLSTKSTQELPTSASRTLIMTYVTVGESSRQPNNAVLKLGYGSDTDSIDSFNGGSRRATSTSGETSTDVSEAPRGHYRGITFEEFLPPQFISSAPPPTQPKRGSVRYPKPSDNTDGPPEAAAASLTGQPSVKRYPSAKRTDSAKSGGGAGASKSRSRIRLGNTARALVRGLSMAKKRDSQGYEAV